MNRRLLLYIKKQPVIIDQRVVEIFKNCKKSMSVQQDIPLLLAGKISSPTVFGFIQPKVLLSSVHMKVLDEQQFEIKQRPPESIIGDTYAVITREQQEIIEKPQAKDGVFLTETGTPIYFKKISNN